MANDVQHNIQEEVDRNFKVFQRQLQELMLRQGGRFALMRDGACIEFFDTARDAQTAGNKLYEDGMFSVQEVRQSVVDLGWYSHAVR